MVEETVVVQNRKIDELRVGNHATLGFIFHQSTNSPSVGAWYFVATSLMVVGYLSIRFYFFKGYQNLFIGEQWFQLLMAFLVYCSTLTFSESLPASIIVGWLCEWLRLPRESFKLDYFAFLLVSWNSSSVFYPIPFSCILDQQCFCTGPLGQWRSVGPKFLPSRRERLEDLSDDLWCPTCYYSTNLVTGEITTFMRRHSCSESDHEFVFICDYPDDKNPHPDQ